MTRFELLVMLCFIPWLAIVMIGMAGIAVYFRWNTGVASVIALLIALVGSWFIPVKLAMKIENFLSRNEPDE